MKGVVSVRSFGALLQWLPSQSPIQFGRPNGPDRGCNRICEACGYVHHEWNETSDGSVYHKILLAPKIGGKRDIQMPVKIVPLFSALIEQLVCPQNTLCVVKCPRRGLSRGISSK